MNTKVRQAVLRILLLTEDFSPDELNQAASFLAEERTDLLSLLSRGNKFKRSSTSLATGERPESSKHLWTKVARDLRESDPEKYRVLQQFEIDVRCENALKSLDELRHFAASLKKDLLPLKSRNEALLKVLIVLSEMDLGSIQAQLSSLSINRNQTDSAFRRLANHIILGSTDSSDDKSS